MEQERVVTEYLGPERRRHQLFVTRNTEYHLRDGVCVAVRDRRSGGWLQSHDALRRQVRGTVRVEADGRITSLVDAPQVGDGLFFEIGGRKLVTSALCSIERPAKNVVSAYPS